MEISEIGQQVALRVSALDEFLSGARRAVVKHELHEVLVLAVGERIRAIALRCTHFPASLYRGQVLEESCEILCPVHQGGFSLETGEATEEPCEKPISVYQIDIRDGGIYVLIPADPTA